MRAGVADLSHHRVEQGASTITQQLARALFYTDQQTIARKIQEALLAKMCIRDRIPLAHAIPLGAVNVEFSWDGDVLGIEAVARTTSQTGVEMEAMVAAAVAALTIYDMTKGIEKGITIESVRLLEKTK